MEEGVVVPLSCVTKQAQILSKYMRDGNDEMSVLSPPDHIRTAREE